MADNSGSKFALFLSFLVAAISFFQPDEYSVNSMPKDVPVQDLLEKYHFIIVGGGSAGIETHRTQSYIFLKYFLSQFLGAVVANRLSEIAHWNVLLIEAGGNENALSDAPGLRGGNGAKMDWLYKIEPQDDSFLGT